MFKMAVGKTPDAKVGLVSQPTMSPLSTMLCIVERATAGKTKAICASPSKWPLQQWISTAKATTRRLHQSPSTLTRHLTLHTASNSSHSGTGSTFDNGGEFARHGWLRDALNMATYFCDAYASWQKGGTENANGRLRRWLPRQTNLDDVSDEDIQEIVMTYNLTPRKCLGYKTPLQALFSERGKDVRLSFA